MECLKCHGLMVTDRITDFFLEMLVWRCVNCGLMMDPTIIRNQHTSVFVHAQPDSVSTSSQTYRCNLSLPHSRSGVRVRVR
jgi:hypothetical protein